MSFTQRDKKTDIWRRRFPTKKGKEKTAGVDKSKGKKRIDKKQ